jgi:glycosyltransferase involved in cell wall biosynthesis
MKNRLIVPLRVKNAQLFIDDWLNCYEKLADGIVVVDNGSTDGTYEKLKAHPKVLAIERTEEFDEGRDIKMLLELARAQAPDWLLTVDVDEIFEERLTRKKLDKMMSSRIFDHFKFRRFHLYKDNDHYMATNEILYLYYCSFGDRSLYRFTDRLFVPELKIHTTIMGRSKFFWQSGYRIKHLPFLHKEYRLKAYNQYLTIDKRPEKQKMYARDVDMLENENKVRVFKFKKHISTIYVEFVLFNFLTVFNLLFRLVKRNKTA